jgi:hypothetical protein
MIEVIIAALLVALISGAVFAGYIGITAIAGGQRSSSQADSLAQADQARLRGLDISQLSGSQGNRAVQTTIDGTVYTVTSASKFVSGSSSSASCSTSGNSSADEVETTSTVTWGKNNGGLVPAVVHGVVTPSAGGSLVTTAEDQSGNPLAGLTATLTGPSSVDPLTTDSNGCATFGGLEGGSYTVSMSAPGYVTTAGATTSTQSVTVVPTETTSPTTAFQFGEAGAISATFQTSYGGSTHASSADNIMVANASAPTPLPPFGIDSTSTVDTYLSTVSTGTSPMSLYPFTTPYSVYAGECTGDLTPLTADQVSATVLPGATTSVVLPLPALIVDVYSGINAATPGSLELPTSLTVTDNACSGNKDYPPIATGTPNAAQGALADPGQPYSSSAHPTTVCVSDGTNKNTANIANDVYTSGNTVSIYLGAGTAAVYNTHWPYNLITAAVAGASGLQGGTCT